MLKPDYFTHASLVEAWKLAAAQVASPKPPSYLTVVSFGAGFVDDNANIERLEKAAASAGAESPSSVASMLIPLAAIRSNGTDAESIERGLQTYGRARRRKLTFSRWTNTYFERLSGAWYDKTQKRRELRAKSLLAMIQKIKSWQGNVQAAFYLHTATDGDNFRKLGSPCLQYVQFACLPNNGLELIALYRSHDYFHKFLGNSLGLQRLGKFVASRTGRKLNGVTIISLHPFSQGTKAALKQYVATS